MRIHLSSALIIVLAILTACNEDPLPVHISGNPLLTMTQDSIVFQDFQANDMLPLNVYMTPSGTAYAAGVEVRPGGITVQGNLWVYDGGIWKSAFDAATREQVMSVRDIDGTPSGVLWAVAGLKSPVGSRYSAALRGSGGSWTDMSPDSIAMLDGVTVAGDDDIWFYGAGRYIPRYRSGAWEMTPLPEPWFSSDSSGLRVTDLASWHQSAYALLEADSAGLDRRILLWWQDTVWTPVYQEGTGAGTTDRKLEALVFSTDGILLAAGDGVYRWEGGKFIFLRGHPDGYRFHCATRSPEGNLMVGGDAGGMVWSDGSSWYGVHLEAPVIPSVQSVAMTDSSIVIGGADSTYALLYGTITRRIP